MIARTSVLLIVTSLLGHASADPCSCAKAEAAKSFFRCKYTNGVDNCRARFRKSVAAIETEHCDTCPVVTYSAKALFALVAEKCVGKLNTTECLNIVDDYVLKHTTSLSISTCCCDPLLEPGQNGHPLCIKGHGCCPEGTWSCSIDDGVTFFCGGENVTNPEGLICPSDSPDEPKTCGLGLVLCPDNVTTVAPDPNDDCKLPPCPGEGPKTCGLGLVLCPDNITTVAPDPNNDCKLPPCPGDGPKTCGLGLVLCPDNITTVAPDPNNDCKLPPCPNEEPKTCGLGLVLCPDNVTTVAPDPNNDCKLPPCPGRESSRDIGDFRV